MSTSTAMLTADGVTINVSPSSAERGKGIIYVVGSIFFLIFGSIIQFVPFPEDPNIDSIAIHAVLFFTLVVWAGLLYFVLPEASRERTLSIANQQLLVMRMIPLLRLRRSEAFDLDKISNIRLDQLQLDGCPPVLSFDYGSKIIEFGQGCRHDEIETMVELVKKVVKERGGRE